MTSRICIPRKTCTWKCMSSKNSFNLVEQSNGIGSWLANLSRVPTVTRKVIVLGSAFTGFPDTSSNTGERASRSEEHTSELQSRSDLVCRLLLEKKKKNNIQKT